MLWEEVEKYERITGESAEKVPISRLGGFLDGYEKAMEVVKHSITDCIINNMADKKFCEGLERAIEIIDSWNE